MALLLTVPEMAQHMRRLVEGMFLEGQLRPWWARHSPRTPVRVGDGLGWRIREDAERFPYGGSATPEDILSSEQLYRSVPNLSFGSCVENFLFRKKGFSMRWNKSAKQKEWRILHTWCSEDYAALVVAVLAMEKRAGLSNPEAYDKIQRRRQLVQNKTKFTEFLGKLIATSALSSDEKDVAYSHFVEGKSIERIAKRLDGSTPPMLVACRLLWASTKILKMLDEGALPSDHI